MPFALLMLVLSTQWRTIELDLYNRSNTWLANKGVDWARAETFNRGRNILLTGKPKTQSDINAAVTGLQGIIGVESVTLSEEVQAPLRAPNLQIAFVDSNIRLVGVLANQADIDRLSTDTAAFFPSSKLVRDKLGSDPSVSELPELSWLFRTASQYITRTSKLAFTLKDSTLSIQGFANSESSSLALVAQLRSQFDGRVDNQLSIAVKKATCQQQINTLLAEQKISFNVASAEITESSHALLDKLETTASRCPKAQFEVVGHTDSNGSLEANLALSRKRAEAVVDYLVERGLSRQRFASRGVGPNEPLGDNLTPEARAKNRRIELRLIN